MVARMRTIRCLFLFILGMHLLSCSSNSDSETTNITELVEIEDSDVEILFIGSSYFTFNNLPELFQNLAHSANREVTIGTALKNGIYLSDHVTRPETITKINERDWDFVVLQGVGSLMAYPEHFADHPVYPSLISLRDMIHQNCATTKIIYCMPWVFEDGMTWYADWTDTYADMQEKIYVTTLQYSDEIGFSIAPVGWVWYAVLEDLDYPLHYLHMSDWNHPSLKGSYLMACVIYSTVFLESTAGFHYYAGISIHECSYFQEMGSTIVLEDLVLWNI